MLWRSGKEKDVSDLEDLYKQMTNRTKGIVLISAGFLLCIGGFLMADRWMPNADLLFNIKNAYITILEDSRPVSERKLGEASRAIRLPFSLVFFISSVLAIIGLGFLFIDSDKKR